MTTFRSTCLAFVICFFTTLTGSVANCLAAEKPFTHPGILHSRAELDFVKAKVPEGEEPWASAWEELRSHNISGLDWNPNPTANVVRGPYNKPDIGGTNLMRDGAAAYSHAIQWYVTGSIYEKVYHHCHDRMGLEMPFTAQVIEKKRPERWQSSHASWGTLMHAGQPAN